MTNQERIKSIADKLVDFKNGDMNPMIVANFIVDSIQDHADDQAFKAVGECKHCYGKGYASVLEPAHVASPDFEGDKPYTVKPSRLEYRFCKCERGQALKHLILTNAHWVLD